MCRDRDRDRSASLEGRPYHPRSRRERAEAQAVGEYAWRHPGRVRRNTNRLRVGVWTRHLPCKSPLRDAVSLNLRQDTCLICRTAPL